ncbi:MAG: FAD:protein FMN transferase [Planctomycetota bacterium]|jgi:thiamine biosynthesis lipoprotein
MKPGKRQNVRAILIVAAAVFALAGLIALGTLAMLPGEAGELRLWIAWPERIMGTKTELKAVASRRQSDLAERALAEAESALRRVEFLMSWRIDGSDITRLNSAKANEFVELSPETLAVLKASREIFQQSVGAFDVTCRPIILRWEKADEEKRLPGAQELAAARAESSWADIELKDRGAVKNRGSACVDLGGIAKGFAIDKAAEAMMKAGVVAGEVNVGGDVRCLGRPPRMEHWPVKVQNPFGDGILAHLRLTDGAVCTSGNYRRFSEIGGERFSHIVDPRPRIGPGAYAALPASSTPPSVTVIAPTGTVADAWATALSVLGVRGLKLLPDDAGIEAMIVTGGPEDYKLHITEGFEKYFEVKPEADRVVKAASRRTAEGR